MPKPIVTVYMPLDLIKISSSIRPLSEKLVENLLKRFENEGCKHDSIFHSIPTVTYSQQVVESLSLAGSSQPIPCNDPRLSNFDLEYLNGKNRVKAAKRHLLDDNKKWWLVKIYSGLSEDEKSTLRQGPSGFGFSDAQIFLHIFENKE